MTKIILIRHCKTKSNENGLMQGYYNDSEFTEEGSKQLKKICEFLRNEKIKRIYCSDLGRAIKTAKAIGNEHNIKAIPLRELREADIGEWRSLPVKEAIQKWVNYYEKEKLKGIPREQIRPLNGENSWDHQKRLMEAIEKIISSNPENTVVIVGHSGTNKVLIGTFENKDPDDFYSIPQNNACINIIETNGKSSKVILLNYTGHLNEKN
jgi:broad specificity phosphatase PhoE